MPAKEQSRITELQVGRVPILYSPTDRFVYARLHFLFKTAFTLTVAHLSATVRQTSESCAADQRTASEAELLLASWLDWLVTLSMRPAVDLAPPSVCM